MPIFRMAWRNVWRNTRRSMVTMMAMTFGLWVMILYSGLMEGYLMGMEEDVLEYEVGDIQIQAEGYLDRPDLYTRIADPDTIVASLEAQGFRAAPRLLAGGLASTGDASAGVSFRGIDIARDQQTLAVDTRIREGSWLQADDPKGVVLGRRLAKALGAKIGGELVVLSQAADGSMANDLLTIRGILAPISDGTDRTAIFMQAAMFRDLMALPDGAHQIIVRRPYETPLDAALTIAQAAAPGEDVRTWRQIMPTIATMVDSARSLIVVIFAIVYLAIGILILNAVLMAVFERIREFGVMKAIGVGPGSVLLLILSETAIQTGLAVASGMLLSLPFVWYMSTYGIDVGALGGTSMMGLAMKEIWYGVFGPAQFLSATAVLVVIVFGAALYPAVKAARIQPVEAMRYR